MKFAVSAIDLSCWGALNHVIQHLSEAPLRRSMGMVEEKVLSNSNAPANPDVEPSTS